MYIYSFYRKRSREDDVSCDSTPLSKRINNLHLSNFEEAQFNHQQHHSINNNNNTQPHLPKDMLMHHHAATASAASASSNGVMKSMNGIDSDPNRIMYNPELNETDNPFYYDKNKLLHELHQERVKRCIV